jgi:ArsR family transcriptional regulator
MDDRVKHHSDDDIIKSAYVLKAMSHPLRLKILCLLCSQSITVQAIVEQTGGTQCNVSRHLAILRKNILNYRKEGSFVYYYIDDHRIKALIETLNPSLSSLVSR